MQQIHFSFDAHTKKIFQLIFHFNWAGVGEIPENLWYWKGSKKMFSIPEFLLVYKTFKKSTVTNTF